MTETVTVDAKAKHVKSWDEAWLVYDLWRDQDPERETWKTKATANKLGVSKTGEEGSYLVIAEVDGVEPVAGGGTISAEADGYDDSWWFLTGSTDDTKKGGGTPLIILLLVAAFAVLFWKKHGGKLPG